MLNYIISCNIWSLFETIYLLGHKHLDLLVSFVRMKFRPSRGF